MRKLMSIGACLLGVVAAQAYTLRGSVVDATTAEKMPGVTVMAFAPADTVRPVLTTMTGADGRYDLALKKVSNYNLKFVCEGYSPVLREISAISDRDNIDIGFTSLEPSSQQLDEIVITGQRPLIEANGSTVTYNMEEDPSAENSTVLEMLRKVPMVTVDAQDNIYVNGQTNFKIYVNGKEDPMLSGNASTVLKNLPAGAIKKIEVILEPGAKYDAEGVGGILNIVTEGKKSVDGYLTTISAGVRNDYFNASLYGRAKFDKVTLSADVSFFDRYDGRTNRGYMERETFAPLEPSMLRQDVTFNNNNKFLNGSISMSWEPDTLNLFTLNVSAYGGWGDNKFNTISNSYDANGIKQWGNTQMMSVDWTWASLTTNASYQHNFNSKGHNIILSYQYNHGWDSQKKWANYYDMENYIPEADWTYDYKNSPTNEHTIQLDYTNPISPLFKLETGAKGIFRRNSSDGYTNIGSDKNNMIPGNDNNTVALKQYQDVGAVYAAYSGSLNKWTLRAGLRYEHTRMGVDFSTPGYDNYHTNLNDFVPNAFLSFNPSQVQSLQASYQMRIRRPGVDELNPHRTEILSEMVQMGNPDLTSENTHTLALTYSNFAGRLSGNVRLFGSISNNQIGSYSYVQNDILYSTYMNVGKRRDAGLSLYGMYRFNNKINLSVNAMVSYVSLKFEEADISNHGWRFNMGANFKYDMPWRLALNAYGGFSTPNISLQSRYSGWHYYGIGLSRSFLKDDRLKVTLNASNMFEASLHFRNTNKGTGYYNVMSMNNKSWSVGASFSYTIGSLQQDVKRTSKSISNDDVESSRKNK